MGFTKFDAVLFDKDGTIFDSEQICCDAWVHTAKAFNVHFSVDMYKDFIGVPTQECYQIAHKQFGPDFPMDQFIFEIRLYMTEKKRIGLPVKKGFDALFQYILDKKIPVGVVTSSDLESTLQSFQNTAYKQKLDVLVTFDDIANPKPAPDCYLLACNKLGVRPERVLVFEDSNAGVKASIAAGCQTAVIPDLVDIEPEILSNCPYTFAHFDQALLFFKLKL
ncbi:HAD family phosphatase [Paraglaciecola aquimarina]|uniref:HAD family phosphatase n=1 Tax=Paraglaciecola algarum TaxID=3050085 RepID=A0ABS9D8Q1_9ALTE|nr:HAD family phosphatase [Paraglaciecola sp. G1-23]MCF2949099.1 HAD family phosphatase [Paraglaciecola sp. G1-23]